MAEQVNIASLTIDTDDVIKESIKLKKQLDILQKEQKELKDLGEESSEQFIQNAIGIKKLSKAYRDNQNFATALQSANEDLVKIQQIEGKTVQELFDSRRELNQIVKNYNATTEEEKKERARLVEVIDEQTEAIRDQSSEFNAGKDSIGEYTKGVNAANFNLREFVVQAEDSGGATSFLTGGLKAAAKGMISFTKATLAFILTPVGLVLAAIAAAFLLIKNAMNRSEESTNKIKKAMSAFSGIIKGLLKFLAPLGDFLIDVLVKNFELLEKAIFVSIGAFESLLRLFNFIEEANALANFTKEIELSVQASKDLTDAELELAKAQRISRKVQLQFQKDAEKLRQIRDDADAKIPLRIKANEDLGRLLKKQQNEELLLGAKALKFANLRIKLEGETADALSARAEAETELVDIQERITGQISEQLVNRVSLRKEASDKIIAINKAEEEASKETAEKKKEENEKAAKASVELARFELNEYIRANKSKLDSDKFLTDEAVIEEERRLNELAEKRREHEKLRLKEGQISQIEFNEAIAVIDAENQASIDALNLERAEAEKVRKAIDSENKFAILEAELESEFVINKGFLDRKKAEEIKNAKETGASVAIINKKFDIAERKLQNDLTLFKQQQNQIILGGLKSLFSESSLIGKAFAIAEIANTTAINATKAFSQAAVFASNPLTLPLAVNANIQGGLIVALGLAQAVKTSGIKLASGGMVKGSGSSKSDSIPALLSNGESVNNANSTRMFAPLYSYLNVLGGGKKFAGGGIAGTVASPSLNLIDYDLLATKVAEAYLNLPNPIVSVEEINQVNSNVVAVENLATS